MGAHSDSEGHRRAPVAPKVDDRQVRGDDRRADWRGTGLGLFSGGLLAAGFSATVGAGDPVGGLILSLVGGGVALISWIHDR